jgi:hypothetical protein
MKEWLAMETTYDPILGGPEQLPYMQLRPLPRPRLGTALVLVSARGELVTFLAGSPAPAVRFGNYRSAYYIDTAEHPLVLNVQLPSSDPGFMFQARLSYRCRVIDPADIAARQLHDIGGLLRPLLIPLMRSATYRLDIAQSAIAEDAVENALRTADSDPAVKISSCSVEFPVLADEAASSGHAFRETHRSNRITEMKVEPLQKLLAGGSPDLLALHLAHHPEDTGPVMEMIVAGDIAEAQNMLQAISIMYGRNGGDEEPFETREERKHLMERFLARALPAGGRYVGGSGTSSDEKRRGGSRLRGTLSRNSDDPPRLVVSEAISEDGARGAASVRRTPDSVDEPSSRRSRRDPDADDEA